MKIFSAILFTLFAFTIVHCSTTTPSSKRSGGTFLTKKQAFSRSSVVSNVKYDMDFTLPKMDPDFIGTTTISFDLKKANDLELDLHKAKVINLTINGKISEVKYDGWIITLPGKHLKTGKNTLTEHLLGFGSELSIAVHIKLLSKLIPVCFDAEQCKPELRTRYRINWH